jgi:hypothetical protein
MPADFAPVFAALQSFLAKYEKKLVVKTDTAQEYTLVTQSPSPFKQHKGQPLFFGMVKMGKAYVSLHLLPLYMCPELNENMAPELKKRMQGKACFNFKAEPEPEQIAELKRLTEAGLKMWAEKKWL